MKALFSTRRALTVTVGVAVATVVGVAVAMWTQEGNGSGGATARQPIKSVVTADTGTADLYPGFAGGDLYFKVTNPNPYPVRFTSMTAGAVTSSDAGACANTNVTVAGKSGLTIDVPANTTADTAVRHKIDDVVTMVSGALDGCQGKTFTIGVTLTGEQVTTPTPTP